MNIRKSLCDWKYPRTKVYHVTFTLRKGNIPHLYFNQQPLPQVDTVKYLGLHFNSRLNWKHHITQTRKRLNHKSRSLHWILGKHSPLSLRNKTLIYKAILRPVWTFGIELWGCASSSNIEILQRYQSKLPRLITQAPWYVANHILHNELDVPTIGKPSKLERILIIPPSLDTLTPSCGRSSHHHRTAD